MSEFNSMESSSFVLSDAVMSPGTTQTHTKLCTNSTKSHTEDNFMVQQLKLMKDISVYTIGNTV